jgi:hypothetical protein
LWKLPPHDIDEDASSVVECPAAEGHGERGVILDAPGGRARPDDSELFIGGYRLPGHMT